MGPGLSRSHRGSSWSSLHQLSASPARVIGADGSLREFSATAIPSCCVSDLLGGSNAVLCSSDAEVPALAADDLLRPGQIYFVLPAAMLGRPLSTSDMAAWPCWDEEAARRADWVRRRHRGQREAQPENACRVRNSNKVARPRMRRALSTIQEVVD
jgi:hypothetical protein